MGFVMQQGGQGGGHVGEEDIVEAAARAFPSAASHAGYQSLAAVQVRHEQNVMACHAYVAWRVTYCV